MVSLHCRLLIVHIFKTYESYFGRKLVCHNWNIYVCLSCSPSLDLKLDPQRALTVLPLMSLLLHYCFSLYEQIFWFRCLALCLISYGSIMFYFAARQQV